MSIVTVQRVNYPRDSVTGTQNTDIITAKLLIWTLLQYIYVSIHRTTVLFRLQLDSTWPACWGAQWISWYSLKFNFIFPFHYFFWFCPPVPPIFHFHFIACWWIYNECHVFHICNQAILLRGTGTKKPVPRVTGTSRYRYLKVPVPKGTGNQVFAGDLII